MVEVQVISQGTIKPSSPTPDHLRHHKLSFLDQIQPPVFMPLVMFFPKDDTFTYEEQAHRIKQSLSQVLTVYYPLAGRVKDNLYVECNDEGVPCVETRVGCAISDVLEDPNPKVMNKFLPFELDNVGNLPAVVQVNSFKCGGLAVSLGISHKIADALSYFTFLNSWAATARGVESEVVRPCFESSLLFPPVDLAGFKPTTGIVKENISTKRFVFDAETIGSLREKYERGWDLQCTRRPTRVEALSAFMWTRFMASTQLKKDFGESDSDKSEKLYTVLHAVNLRPRMDPPLTAPHFGNISRFAVTLPSIEAMDDGGDKIVKEVRDAIKMINKDYVKKLQDGVSHLNFMKERAATIAKGEIVSFSFTSLCRFPIYEADFGWGKPIWVGSASLTFKNLVVFMDTKYGDGIEAWVNLKEEDMKKFQQDKELLAHTNNHTIVI